jgi:hypothetical protein
MIALSLALWSTPSKLYFLSFEFTVCYLCIYLESKVSLSTLSSFIVMVRSHFYPLSDFTDIILDSCGLKYYQSVVTSPYLIPEPF